jgi:DNA (cytosine-5)-methyltransferase 1
MGGPGSSGRDGGLNLRTAVSKWPTPTARDYKDVGPNTNYKRLAEKKILAGAVVMREQFPTTGSLNPTWVEWLMGFPSGWTDLEPSETQ